MRNYTEEEILKIKQFNLNVTMYDSEKFKTPVDAILADEAKLIIIENDSDDYYGVLDFFVGGYNIIEALGVKNMRLAYLYYGYNVVKELIDEKTRPSSDKYVDSKSLMVLFLQNMMETLDENILVEGKEYNSKNLDNNKFHSENFSGDLLDYIFQNDYLGKTSIKGISIRKAIELANSYDNKKDYKIIGDNPILKIVEYFNKK